MSQRAVMAHPAVPVEVVVGLHPELLLVAEADGELPVGAGAALAHVIDPQAARDLPELIIRLRGLPAYALQERLLGAALRDRDRVNQVLAGELALADALALAPPSAPPVSRLPASLLAQAVDRPAELRRLLLDVVAGTWKRRGAEWNRRLPAMQRERLTIERALANRRPLPAAVPFALTGDGVAFADGSWLPASRVAQLTLLPSAWPTPPTWLARPVAATSWQLIATVNAVG